MATAFAPAKTIHIGVLCSIPHGKEGSQLLDLSPVDLFTCISRPYLGGTPGLERSLVDASVNVEYYYISSSLEPYKFTTNLSIIPTHTYDTAPALDYLWVPGSVPHYVPSAEEVAFVRERYPSLKALFTACTGAVILAKTGLVDGKRATCSRGLIPLMKKFHPQVQWTDEFRWVVEDGGRIWSSGGPQCALDMVGQFMLDNYPRPLVEFAFEVAAVSVRKHRYDADA